MALTEFKFFEKVEKGMSGILPRLDKMDDRVHPIRFRDHDRKSRKKGILRH
jgi:hypothetical protein